MTARILVVDDVLANVKLLEARLSAEYFDVVTAMNGEEALEICARGQCDLVLLDVMMPGLDGFEVCRRLKNDAATAQLPIVMVTALDQPSDRVKGLEAGADDFLTKPINELALITRVRSLVRLKNLTDELMARAASTSELGLKDSSGDPLPSGDNGRILLVEDKRHASEKIVAALAPHHRIDVESDPQEALFRATEGAYDLAIVSLGLAGFDALRLCSQLRSLDRTRMLPILVLVETDDAMRLIRALDLGVNDYLMRPIDGNELLARVRTQIRRHRFSDRLRDSLQMTMEMAITDALTGLHNRRYLERHLGQLLNAGDRDKPLSLLVLDIDHFKAINDTHGHDGGDDVLREFARRLRKTVRGIDLVCRLGGEEFVVVMPETTVPLAHLVAERIRSKIGDEPFAAKGGAITIPVTVSIGLAGRSGEVSAETLIRRADEALYEAKRAGRNRTVSAAA